MYKQVYKIVSVCMNAYISETQRARASKFGDHTCMYFSFVLQVCHALARPVKQ